MAEESLELKQLEARVKSLEKAMGEYVTGGGGAGGSLQTAIKKKANTDAVDAQVKAIRDAIEANGKFDVTSREMIEALNALMDGDELSPGIRRKLSAIEEKMSGVDAVVLKVNGDGTDSNKGLADRFVAVEQASQSSQTMAKTIGYIMGVGGLTIAGFFWNYLSGGITDNGAEIKALQAEVQTLKVQRAEDIGKIDSLKTRTETDRQWAEKAIDYLKK
jgi:hypothetical protein